MPSAGKRKRSKPSRKTSRKKSELDSALSQISDESVAEAKEEFQDLLTQAKGDTSELVRQNAEELERRLVLLKKAKDRQGGLRFLRRKPKARSSSLYRQPAGTTAGTR